MVRDVICDMDVDVDEAESRGLMSEYDGRVFYFCSSGCKRIFDEDPMAYGAGLPGGEEDIGSSDFPSAHE